MIEKVGCCTANFTVPEDKDQIVSGLLPGQLLHPRQLLTGSRQNHQRCRRKNRIF